MKVVFCTLYLSGKPHPAFLKSLEECLPAVEAAGFEHMIATEVGCPYISMARAKVLRKALDGKADIIMFLDYDVSWTPEDMVKILTTEGDVIAGTYRKKRPEEEYMSVLLPGPQGLIVREDGCIKAEKVPAGFLKLTRKAVQDFALAYPELLFGDPLNYSVDMFNHGTIDGIWHGEDYAFSHRWLNMGRELWIVPDLNIDHNKDDKCYKGNLHKYLLAYKKSAPIESNPLVSVVIPCYNYGRFIGEAIESVLLQTYNNIELIVVDDGSTDNTGAVVQSFAGVQYFHRENGGSASARNYGIARSKGEWIVCLDADDTLELNYIEECLKMPEADIISTGIRMYGLESKRIIPAPMPSYLELIDSNQIHCASMFRREVWEVTGGYDEELHSVYDDWELWVNAARHGFRIKVVQKVLFNYRKHGPSAIDGSIGQHDILHDKILRKHGEKLDHAA